LKAVVVNFDSSYPDTDSPSDEIIDGTPSDRFAPQAYQSTEDVTVHHAILNPLPIKSSIGERAPKGSLCLAASMPFSDSTVGHLDRFRSVDRQRIREHMGRVLEQKGVDPKITDLLSNGSIFLPFIASGDYFDPGSVGKWMTQEQYDDMIAGAKTVIRASA